MHDSDNEVSLIYKKPPTEFKKILTKVGLKKAIKNPSTDDHKTRSEVQKILSDIEKSREKAINDISKKFDNYEGEIIVSQERIANAEKQLDKKIKDDIKFAYDRIKKF